MKIKIALVLIILLTSCAELQTIADTVLEDSSSLTDSQIGKGLKEALEKGVETEVQKLTLKDGFYRNELVKIILPEEIQNVDKALRKVGLGSVADEGIKLMNRAAEEAVKEATPIFLDAIEEMTITDAKSILLGDKNAATLYLENKTQTELYAKFLPIINSSFSKVGADEIWTMAIDKYNSLPLTQDVNNNLTEYVTQEALNSVYKMIEVEELKIRNDIGERTSNLLQQVFALQD